MPDADFSKGTTSFSPGITLSTQKFLSTCNVLVHPLQWGDRGRGVSEQWSSLALTCDTVFPLSLCGDSPPETRGRRSFQKMTRIFWLLWSWKMCLLVWSPTCWAESLNWTHAPIWLPYNVSRELNKINSYCVWGVPPPRSHVWQSAPLRLIFFQRSELLSDPRGPSNPPSPQQLWTVRSWRQDFYRQRLVRSSRFHEYLRQKQETATVWTWCRESELFF